MSEALTSVSVASPGFMGLNTQDSGTTLDISFALTAENCVLDQSGRIACRKGWTTVNATSTDLGSADITCLGEFVKTDGTTEIISIGNKRIFKGTTTLTELYNDNTWTGTNWKMVSFNGGAYFFQRGHDPLFCDGSTLVKLSAVSGYSGSVPLAHEVLAAFGRLWTLDTTSDKVTLKWSDTLIGKAWTGGSSGSLDLTTVFPSGTDSGVALADYNGFLVIFGKQSVIIYEGPDNPSTMTKRDGIGGVGCLGRDTVQDIGTDLLFLSNSGVQSLGKVIQEKSAPLTDISRNVRDDLIAELILEDNTDDIKSVYSPKDAFYLLSFPVNGKIYCFDTRSKLQDGSLRVTTWVDNIPTAFLATRDRKLYFGKAGYIGEYNGYLDNASTYIMTYFTNNISGGDFSRIKILKKMGLLIIGGEGNTTLCKWVTDYGVETPGVTVSLGTATSAEYGTAEYGVSEYLGTTTINRVLQSLSGSGKVFRVGVVSVINDVPLALQQMDVFFKLGRVI